jgi:hypothetical protein
VPPRPPRTPVIPSEARDVLLLPSPRKERAAPAKRTRFALRLAALTHFLPVALQEQVGSCPRIKFFRHFCGDQLLRHSVIHTIALACRVVLNTHQHVHAVRRHRGNRRQISEQQNAVGSRAGDSRKHLQLLAGRRDRSNQRSAQIPRKFIFRPQRDLSAAALAIQEACPRPESADKFCLRGSQQFVRSNANFLIELLPPLTTRGIACRISAMPPHDEFVRLHRPTGFLRAMKHFQPVEQIGNGERDFSHLITRSPHRGWRQILRAGRRSFQK